MAKEVPSINALFLLLQGTWTGEGRGEFPGVTSFSYRETLTFTRQDAITLNYEQKTQKLYDGQAEYLPSHAENGFIHLLENGELELVSTQKGRSEVLVGSIQIVNVGFRIHFVSKTIADDPRVSSSTRTWGISGDILRYEMEMHTTKVDRLMPHLRGTLQRVKS